MRTAARARVERHARAVVDTIRLPVHLTVAWTLHPMHGSRDVLADAFTFGSVAVIVLDEPSFEAADADSREDTIRHEIAHLLAWHRHGHDIADHGAEWRAARRDIDRLLDEEIDAT
jgi:hypothetical protein